VIGSLLGERYEITGLLGEATIFATYSARDRHQGRDVAVRVLRQPFSRDSVFVARLRETVKKYSVLRSANIETLYEVDQDDANSYVVGDLTRGPSLADRIRKLAPFSIPVSVGTAISLCQALDVIHRAKMAHGDLNPTNIAVLADGDVRLQLTGVWEAYSASATAAAMVLPTMSPYLAPEIASGAYPSPTSDVYSVGVLLYELLAGRLPYYADSPVAMALQHANSPTPSVREINPSVPTVLDEIVRKAMSKDPNYRYAAAGELLADLRALQDALRFGRQLTWPLGGASGAAAPAAAAAAASAPRVSKTKAAPAPPQPVAPRMGALRTEEEFEQATRKKPERDVPVWMLVVITFLVAAAFSLVGVWMLLNLNKPRMVSVPNIKGLSAAEARAVLKDSKLEMRVSGREANERVELDHVLEVEPAAGDKIREGGNVGVVLSSGSRQVAVPDITGRTIDKAKSILSSLNLEIDTTIERVRSTDVEEGLVVRTDPPAKTPVRRESRVKLVVSGGPDYNADNAPATPANSGFLYTLRVGLSDLEGPTRVRIEMSDGGNTKVIHDAEHMPGDNLNVSALGQARQAEFRFYYNDELVQTVTKEAEGDSSNP